LLWAAALGSTVAPDLDVVYNALFRGFVNHSMLWTHSLFLYLAIGLGWSTLCYVKRWPYLKLLVGLITFGGLSHLLLDAIGHRTPLLFPFSMRMFGVAPKRVVDGGLSAYLTDPVFLLEPLAFLVAFVHWTLNGNEKRSVRAVVLSLAVVVVLCFCAIFLLVLPRLQSVVANH
jgi:hypothetical protein